MQMNVKAQSTGLNTFTVAGGILLAGIVFGAISPWWLTLSIPLMFLGYAIEHEQKPVIK